MIPLKSKLAIRCNRLFALNMKYNKKIKDLTALYKSDVKKYKNEINKLNGEITRLKTSSQPAPGVELKKRYINTEYRKLYREKMRNIKKTHIFQTLSKKYIKKGIQLSPQELWSMAKKQKCLCGISGVRLKGNVLSLDHIIPKSRGGSDDKDNLRLTCLHMNIAKRSHTDSEFLELCKSVVNYNVS